MLLIPLLKSWDEISFESIDFFDITTVRIFFWSETNIDVVFNVLIVFVIFHARCTIRRFFNLSRFVLYSSWLLIFRPDSSFPNRTEQRLVMVLQIIRSLARSIQLLKFLSFDQVKKLVSAHIISAAQTFSLLKFKFRNKLVVEALSSVKVFQSARVFKFLERFVFSFESLYRRIFAQTWSWLYIVYSICSAWP